LEVSLRDQTLSRADLQKRARLLGAGASDLNLPVKSDIVPQAVSCADYKQSAYISFFIALTGVFNHWPVGGFNAQLVLRLAFSLLECKLSEGKSLAWVPSALSLVPATNLAE
jgi:hypothetical protein